MSERLRKKLGDELYAKIIETGLKTTEFDLLDGYIPRDRLNEVSNKLKVTEGKITDYEKQLNETKEMLKGNEELQTKYSSLDKKYKLDLSAKDAEIVNIYKTTKVREKLKDAGAKHPDLLMSKVDLQNLTLDNNNLIGFDTQLESIKAEYKDLFAENIKQNSPNLGNNNKGENRNPNDIDWETKLSFIK